MKTPVYVERDLLRHILPFLNRKEAIAIVGPRQAGKTTFLLHLADIMKKNGKKTKFFTFEKESDLRLFQENIEDFKDFISPFDVVFIDEFQYARDGGKKLKYLYDTTGIKFFISGSSSLELTFLTGRFMVGRMLKFELFPFSFREFLEMHDHELFLLLEKRFPLKNGLADFLLRFEMKQAFQQEIHDRLSAALAKYLIFGGYPAISLAKTPIEKEKLLESIVENYILKDIRGLLRLITEDELLRLSRFLATQIGGMVQYSELAMISLMPHHQIKKHLRILEETYVLELLKPFFVNRRTELVKNPKIYFLDIGLRNYLIRDFREMPNRPDFGHIAENYVFSAFRKHQISPLRYWRTKSQAEVDFVLEIEGGV
ncbi:ATP-binding protein, partial [Candidatus Peregrinibacteria bacterium]|nr:ATP-binding protein [Candidatus Peregrinibacteria bacterium]